MIGTFLATIFISVAAGVIAAVYLKILAYEPVLNWWFKFGNKFEGRWFYPPIWGCIRCVSGQMGLWAFIFLKVTPMIMEFEYLDKYISIVVTAFELIFCICLAIYIGTKTSETIKD